MEAKDTSYRDWQAEMVAAGLCGTRLIREAARRLALERLDGGGLPRSGSPLVALAGVLGEAHRAFQEVDGRVGLDDRLREGLTRVIAAAWRAAIDLGIASDGPIPEPPEVPPRPAEHEALDHVFAVLQIRGWDPSRVEAGVAFVDDEGRPCLATVSLDAELPDEPGDADDDQAESEGEVRPAVRVGQVWEYPPSGSYAIVMNRDGAFVGFDAFYPNGAVDATGKVRSLCEFRKLYPRLRSDVSDTIEVEFGTAPGAPG